MRKRCFSQMCLLAATLVVAAATSHAQQPPAGSGRLSLSERVGKLEQQAQGINPAQGNIELVNQINALQSQVQTLQGQLEELKHQLDELKQRNKEQYIDLDSRLVRIEGHAPSATQSPHAANDNQLQDIPLGSADDASVPASDSSHSTIPPTSTTSNDPAAEKAAYDQAFAALKDGRYAESARRFQAFIGQYPKGELTSNAYYWLGESYYVTQNYRLSLETFQHLLNQFPTSQKVADALLKVGYCQYEMKDWAAAEASLNQVVQKYPDTTVARLAQGRLRALKLEGRH